MPSGMKRVFATPLTAVDSEAKEAIGTIRFEGNKIYKYVKILNTTATVAGVSGDVACYTAEDGAEDHEVCLDKSDADSKPIAAGVIQAAVTGTAGTAEYGWIQIKGPATLNTDIGGTPADGDSLMAGTTDLAMEKLTNDDTTETNDGHPCGVINDDSAGKVILDCPF